MVQKWRHSKIKPTRSSKKSPAGPSTKKVETSLKAFLKSMGVEHDKFTVMSGNEWKARGETLGTGASAVALIEESSLFNIVNMYGSIESFDKFNTAMDKAGLNWEPIYSWAIGFYK